MATALDAEKLVELAGFLRTTATEIERIASSIPRKPGIPRTKALNKAMTAALGVQVRRWKTGYPEWSIQRIGQRLMINSGRVSEALNPGTLAWSAPKNWKCPTG